MAWSAIRGQAFPIRVLRTHLATQRVPNAYLFAGPDGIGKRLTATELAKAINCERPDPERGACDACAVCQRIERQTHPDVHWIKPPRAGAAIRIDEVREAVGRLMLRPFSARMQVAIIDGAHRLTDEAANSLLKILEEPPTWSRFVLTSAQPAHCLPTIVSRCQTIRFQRLPQTVVAELLVGLGACDAATASTLSVLAQGDMASAQEIAEHWDEYQRMIELFRAVQPAPWLGWTAPTDRQELGRWLSAMIWWLRDLAMAASGQDARILHAGDAAALQQQASAVDPDRCVETAMRVVGLWDSLDHAGNARLVGTLLREEWLSLASGERS